MNKIITAILFSFILLTPVISIAGEISKVSIRNEHFEIIAVLKDSKSIQSFEAIWNKKTKLSSPVKSRLLYKIDIEGKNHSDRWLYSPEGFVILLSKAKTPTYKISSVDEFNKLIQIPDKINK